MRRARLHPQGISLPPSAEWNENALRLIRKEGLSYEFINSHYWDAGVAGQHLAEALNVPHVHTPHSLGMWKQRQMQTDYPDEAELSRQEYNFPSASSMRRSSIAAAMVIATTPPQLDILVDDYDVVAKRAHDSAGLRRQPVLSGE